MEPTAGEPPVTKSLTTPPHCTPPPTILLTVLEKPWLFVLVKTQPFRVSVDLGTSSPAPEGPGRDLRLHLLLTSSHRPTGHGTALSGIPRASLGQPQVE